MKKAVLKPVFWIVVSLVVSATAGKALLNEVFDDFKAYGDTESWSVAEARQRGVLVAELTAVPNELPLPGGQIRFGEVWVEERALTTHKFVWLPYEQRVGGYRLHFTLLEGRELKENAKLMFMREGCYGSSIGGNACSDGQFVYIIRLDSPNVSDLRIGLVSSFDSPLGQTVRFVAK